MPLGRLSLRSIAISTYIVLVAIAVLGACSDRECGGRSPAPASTLVIAGQQIEAFPEKLVFNPLRLDGQQRWAATRAMYEPMAIYNPLAHLPGRSYLKAYAARLASDWHIDAEHDRLEFELRPGVVWSDGEPLVAEDVVATFELLAAHSSFDPLGVTDDIESFDIERSDSKKSGDRVIFQLKRGASLRFHDIAQQPIVPAHIWEDVRNPETFKNSSPVATGPFVEVVEQTPEYYEVARNPSYWGESSGIERLRLPALRDNVAANCALNSGDVDWAGDFIADVQERFVGSDPDFHESWAAEAGGGTVSLVTRPGHPVLSDPEVRRAIAVAIAPEPIIASAMNGLVSPASATGLADVLEAFQSDEALDMAKAEGWYSGRAALANRMLDEADWPRAGNGLRAKRLRFVIPEGYTDWEVAAESIFVNQLAAIGFDVEVHGIDEADWEKRLDRGEDYELTMRWVFLGPTPYHYYHQLFRWTAGDDDRSHIDHGHFVFDVDADDCDARDLSEENLDDLLERLRRHVDPEVAEAECLIDALQIKFVREVPAIPIYVGGSWAQYNKTFFVGFPNAQDPYAPGNPHMAPQSLLVLDRLRPRPR